MNHNENKIQETKIKEYTRQRAKKSYRQEKTPKTDTIHATQRKKGNENERPWEVKNECGKIWELRTWNGRVNCDRLKKKTRERE